MKSIKGYKFIRENMKSKNGNHTWEIGKWYEYDGEISLCEHGFHACRTPAQAFNYIYGDKFFVVEAKGKIIKDNKSSEPKFVASQMKLIKELPLKKIAVQYACACARECLKNYENKYPNDKRVSQAIQAAEDYMDGKISLEEISAAESAAWSAAGSAWSDARSAAGSAAESAAWSAAGSAAWKNMDKILNKIVNKYE